jgi:hypothetical protein
LQFVLVGLPAGVGGLDEILGLAIVFGVLVAEVMIAGGKIEVTSKGVHARNLFTSKDFPWASIEGFEAAMRVAIVTSDRKRHALWAVQRSNFAAMAGRRTRVDVVVGELEELRKRMDLVADPNARPRH